MMAHQDIDYDREDFGLNADELAAKYGREHPIFVMVAHTAYKAMPTRDVKLDYWDWVVREIKKDDDAMPSNVTEPAPAAFQDQLTEQQVEEAEMVDVNSVDQFAGFISHWHSGVVGRLRQLLDMPEGQTATVTVNGVKDVIELSGEAHRGYRVAMLTAIMQFEQLPFAVTAIDAVDSTFVPPADDGAPKH
jgi:hypothetical protein